VAPFRYRPDVLSTLLTHGVRPTPHTPPALVRSYLNDLYRLELRRLRARLLQGEFHRRDYASRVVALRRRYPLLSLPVEVWTD
jgi:hypothetical protein